MAKDVSFHKKAMDKMVKGIDIAAEAVCGTLGPKGLNVYIDDPMTPKITNDGATIADKIVLEDKLENAGAYVIRNTSAKTNDDAGDGTTTTALLVSSLIHECLKRPENQMEVKESLKLAGDKVLKELLKNSVKITKEDIEKVALISSENEELAKLITEIINKLGEKAVINVEESKTFKTEYEIVDGYEAAVGFMSPHFINQKGTAKAIYSDIPVLVSRKKISNIIDIQPIFEQFKEQGIGQCVFVVEEIDDAMLGVLVINKLNGLFNSLVIRATGELLDDIAGSVGATVISDATGNTFQNITLDVLGRAKKVVCDANKTLFLGDKKVSKDYARALEEKADSEPNQYVQKQMMKRVAKLKGGIAVLKIGASSDFEKDYLMLKAEDAVKAVQAALEEGVVEGGGMALWRIADAMKPKTIGEEILKKTLTAPLRKILENAGVDYSETVRRLPEGQGYNAKTGEYQDLIKEGIVDPTKVERVAIENSISAASTFCTTFCVISERKEAK